MMTDINVEHSLVIQRSITSIDRYSQAICVQTTSSVSTVEHVLTCKIPDDLCVSWWSEHNYSFLENEATLLKGLDFQTLVGSSKDFKSQAAIVCHIWIKDLLIIQAAAYKWSLQRWGGGILLLHQKGA